MLPRMSSAAFDRFSPSPVVSPSSGASYQRMPTPGRFSSSPAAVYERPAAPERYVLQPMASHDRIVSDEAAHIQRRLAILKHRANISTKLSVTDRLAPIEYGYSLQPVVDTPASTYRRPVRLVPFVDPRSVCDSNNNMGNDRAFSSNVKTDQERADTMWMNIGNRLSNV